MSAQIKLRRDTAANWTSVNPVLATGEPGLETDTLKVKYGDGATRWNALSYPTVVFPSTIASATSATNLSGGTSNQLLVQIAPGVTGFITAPSIPGFLQWTGSSFTWSSTSTVAAAQTLTGSILAPNVTTAVGLTNIGTTSVLTQFAGNLSVVGTSSLTSGLSVTGASTITGNTTITGTTNVVGSLKIKGVDFKVIALALAAAMA
jgi:hypothetical protein